MDKIQAWHPSRARRHGVVSPIFSMSRVHMYTPTHWAHPTHPHMYTRNWGLVTCAASVLGWLEERFSSDTRYGTRASGHDAPVEIEELLEAKLVSQRQVE